MIELIYCANGNAHFANIAIEAGFLYGAQVPNTVYYPPYFCDQDWKRPDFERYMAALKEHRPSVASVLDWETEDQLPEVLKWGESAAAFVDVIVIIPKVVGGLSRLPQVIGGKPVRLGYSVPTRFGGTQVPVWEFYGRPAHLLGGSPQKQLEISKYINVVSVDGNMCQKMAIQYCSFFDPLKRTRRGYWASISDYDGGKWGGGDDNANAHHEAFRRSCINIMAMWRKEL